MCTTAFASPVRASFMSFCTSASNCRDFPRAARGADGDLFLEDLLDDRP